MADKRDFHTVKEYQAAALTVEMFFLPRDTLAARQSRLRAPESAQLGQQFSQQTSIKLNTQWRKARFSR